jgi:hypothetical protein
MLDLLAQTDPLSVGGWLILLVALGMYPVGILLPGCCGCGAACAQCSGSLPNTVTVTFGTLADEIAGPYNHEVEFLSWYENPSPAEKAPSYGYPYEFGYPHGWPMFAIEPVKMGSGAVARVTTTGGAVFGTEGGITGVQLLSGGSGYAERGRAAPTLTITGSGTGATFTPTLSSSGSPAVWTLASVAASGGTGYTDGETLTITAAGGDTVASKATATLTARRPPTITATAGGTTGSGATLAVTLAESGATPTTWVVASISVTSGGTGYKAGDPVTLAHEGDVVVSGSKAATVTISDERTTPGFAVDATDAGGTGAKFAFTYVYDPTFNDWELTAITVTNGGTGYTAAGAVVLTKTADTEATGNDAEWSGTIALDYTVSGGAITGVSGWGVPLNGLYGWRLAGIVNGVTFNGATTYYRPGGPAVAVTVTNGGQYYNEDPSLPPRVATVSTRVYPDRMGPFQPPLASHALIRPTIDTNTASATFGQITALTIDAAGAGYTSRTAWLGKRCCRPLYDGKAFVLQRATPGAFEEPDWCVYEGQSCNGWAGLGETYLRLAIPNYQTPPTRSALVRAGAGGYVSVPRVAPRLPYMTVNTFGPPAPCRMYFESATRLTDCETLSLTLEAGSTATATVVGGGTYQAGDPTKVCLSCCTAGAPLEISGTLAYMAPPGSPTTTADTIWKSEYDYWQEEGYPSPPGTYALQWDGLAAIGGVTQGRGWRFYDPTTTITVGVAYGECDQWFNQSTRFPGAVDEELLKDVYRNASTRYTGLVQWDDHVGTCGSDCDRKCLLLGVISNSERGFFASDYPTTTTPISSNGTTADAGYEVTSDYYTTSAHNSNGDTKAFAFNTTFLTKEVCDRCQSSVCSLAGKTFSIVKNYGGQTNPAWRVIATLTIT